MKSSKHWSLINNTFSTEQLRELQLKRFKSICEYAYNNSPAYRKLYDEAGFNPTSINSINDIQKVPIIDKAFISSTLDDSIYGSMLSVDEKEVFFYHQTSGSTSLPVCQPDTVTDWAICSECWAELLWEEGVRATDRVMIAFNYNLFYGFWGAHYGCERLGAEVVPGGGLTTEQKLIKMQELNVSVLISTPTYVFRIIEYAKNNDIDLKKLNVKKIICAGEPGALIDSVKKKLEDAWGCDVYDHIGATEVGAWGYECSEKCGSIHINEAMFYPELIKMDSNEPVTEPNEYGRVVITAFGRSARPCIRFNTNDVACWDEHQCSCGSIYRMFRGGIQGRVDHIIKVRGTFVNPVVIENILCNNPKCGDCYRIFVNSAIYSLKVEIEALPDVEASFYPELSKQLNKEIFNRTFLNFQVEILPYGTLERSNAKSKKVVIL
ncbi:MAG: phenylacetate--CoA ligase family protein [Acutalibacteraceae bacterium]|nr:phenylacetate--CoA ligase family protein [Acutalibacteraceae bacterium]